MKLGVSAPATACLHPAEKRYNTINVEVTKFFISSSVDTIYARQNRAGVCRESAYDKRPSRFCAMREASNPKWVDASTIP